jgi:hypothetical protein
MPKNILIFSDGTGQAGGLRPDENRSNIYKLFRATRCGPDTEIDPRGLFGRNGLMAVHSKSVSSYLMIRGSGSGA